MLTIYYFLYFCYTLSIFREIFRHYKNQNENHTKLMYHWWRLQNVSILPFPQKKISFFKNWTSHLEIRSYWENIPCSMVFYLFFFCKRYKKGEKKLFVRNLHNVVYLHGAIFFKFLRANEIFSSLVTLENRF